MYEPEEEAHMFTAAISTFALIMAIGPQLNATLQAIPSEAELVDPATVQPPVEPPVQVAVDTAAKEKPTVAKTPATVKVPPPQVEAAEPITRPATTPDTQTPEAKPVKVEPQENTRAPAAEVLTPETARPEPAPTVSPIVPEAEWPTILNAARTALSDAKTAQGKFIQTNSDGSFIEGSFALNRPGKMRFDYNDPSPILIVADGTTVAMQDSELETIDRIPLASTPLGLILDSDLDFGSDVDVLGIQRNADKIGIRVSDATGELEGTLTMVFDAASYELLGWLAIDGNRQTTVVDLIDVTTNGRLDPRLFRLDEEEDEEDER